MFRSVLVPLDGSAIAAQAIAYAARIAEPGAPMTLVAVVEPPMEEYFAHGSASRVAEQMAFSREILTRDVDRQAEQLRSQGFPVTTAVPTGDATEAIIQCAHEAHADLIAMTTHGTGGISRWLLGSVTNRVLHASQIPVLIVRARAADQRAARDAIDGIIAPLDGSAHGEAAAQAATALAKRLALPLRFVRVVDDETSLPAPAPLYDYEAARRLTQMLANARTRAEAFIEEMVALACASGIEATGIVLAGSPATRLIPYCGEHPDALVVIATHGEGGAQPWAFGSVAEKIITAATNPTLVLRTTVPQRAEIRPAQAKAAQS
jgi:nucleotide-binding universal stress UspA family protein